MRKHYTEPRFNVVTADIGMDLTESAQPSIENTGFGKDPYDWID